MFCLRPRSSRCTAAWIAAVLLALAPLAAVAGGPKYVAGVSFFNPAEVGQPLHWANGQLNYYVDQGPLNGNVSNQQAKAMVDAAAALWSAIPTAGVTLTDRGALNEDVSGGNLQIGSTGFTVTGEQIQQLGVIPELRVHKVICVTNDAVQSTFLKKWLDSKCTGSVITRALVIGPLFRPPVRIIAISSSFRPTGRGGAPLQCARPDEGGALCKSRGRRNTCAR